MAESSSKEDLVAKKKTGSRTVPDGVTLEEIAREKLSKDLIDDIEKVELHVSVRLGDNKSVFQVLGNRKYFFIAVQAAVPVKKVLAVVGGIGGAIILWLKKGGFL
jgi:hypothetical protein